MLPGLSHSSGSRAAVNRGVMMWSLGLTFTFLMLQGGG